MDGRPVESPKSLSILREVCEQTSIEYENLDTFSGWFARIAKGGKSFLVGAAGIGLYPINRAPPFGIARDKAFTHYVLRRGGFRVPEGEHFFLSAKEPYSAGRGLPDALRYGEVLTNGFEVPLIAKANSGKGANHVWFVRSRASLARALEIIASVDRIALVQRFVDQPEFRLFLVDGEVVFAYRKSRPEIEGDNHSTVEQLCASHLPASEAWNALGREYLDTQLSLRGLRPSSVLETGTKLQTHFVSNISAHGRLAGFVEPSASLRSWADNLAKAVSLRVTGIDVLSRSGLAEDADRDIAPRDSRDERTELAHRVRFAHDSFDAFAQRRRRVRAPSFRVYRSVSAGAGARLGSAEVASMPPIVAEGGASRGQWSSQTSGPFTARNGQGGCSVQVPVLK